MHYLFILESIGTSELMLIGLVALIVFGPRKIPELARTVGKVMSELRRSTDDFKKTWEKEAGFEPGNGSIESRLNSFLGNRDDIDSGKMSNQDIFSPEVKQLNKEDIERNFPKELVQKTKETNNIVTSKSDWL